MNNDHRFPMKIGLFYGSTTCYTEMAAEKIQQIYGNDMVELHNIKDVPLSECQAYDLLIFGISTWDYGELQEDWESHWQDIASLDLSGKVIALFGMGDQVGYPEWFQDALGMLHDEILPQSPLLIGAWPNEGYEFIASKALTSDEKHFVGLALDEDNQYHLSEERLNLWVQQLQQEISDIFA